jgi:hypothetical protein
LASFNRDLPTLAVSQKPHSLPGSHVFARTRARASRRGRFLKAGKSGASNLPNRLPSDTFATPHSSVSARALAKRLTSLCRLASDTFASHIIYPRSRKHSRPTAICARIDARKLHTWRRRAISKRTRTSIRQRPRACRQQRC